MLRFEKKGEENMETNNWLLEGQDTFEGTFYPLGRFDSEQAAQAAARDRLAELEESQPTAVSGGQGFVGTQDHVFVVCPDGRKYRVCS